MENSSDGSLYLFLPNIFGNTGAHLSFHASKTCHFRTRSPVASSSTFEIHELLSDINRKKESFLTRADLSKFGPGMLAILKIEEVYQNLRTNDDFYRIFGKRFVVSSRKFRNLIQETPFYPYENLEHVTQWLMKNRDIKQSDILIAIESNSSSIFTGVPAHGDIYGAQIDLDSASSFNKLPGYEILKKPVIELIKSGTSNNASGPEPLPFF